MSTSIEHITGAARDLVAGWLRDEPEEGERNDRATLEALGHRALEAIVDADPSVLADWLGQGPASALPREQVMAALCDLLAHAREAAADRCPDDGAGLLELARRSDATLAAAVAAIHSPGTSSTDTPHLGAELTDTLYSRTPDGLTRYVSDGVRALTGHDPAALVAGPRLLEELVVPEDASRLADLLRLVRTRKQPMEAVYRIRNAATGKVRHVLDRANPRLSADGEVTQIDGILVDITDRVELEAQLERSEQLRSLGQLAGDVAHDFNNLLMGVLGHADLLARMLRPDSREAAYVALIVAACERGSRLSERLQKFARGAASPSHRIPTDVAMVASDTAETARPSAPPHVLLDVVRVGEPPPVLADRARLGEAILNIVLNAIQACERATRGHVGVTIRAATRDERARVGASAACVVEVGDDGPGMHEEVLSRVFEPLFTTRQSLGGSGLGCAMAYGITVEHGGVLEVESEQGVGTAFRFILPAAEPASGDAPPGDPPPVPEPEDPAAQTRPIARPRATTRAEDGRARVLVVDDEASVRFLLRDLLDGAGFRVTTAAGGREALERVREHPSSIDLAILDVMMAPMDGTETYTLLKQLNPSLPVIFCTAYSDESRISAPGVLRSATIVRKPFRAANLIRAVREALPPEPPASDSEPQE